LARCCRELVEGVEQLDLSIATGTGRERPRAPIAGLRRSAVS
jgi:hypothetical protein